MSDMIQTGFDYAALPVESADRLQIIKRDIAIIDTLACVQIGQKLKEAQAELNMRGKKGSGFQEWVESETPYALTAAYEMIRIATRFGGENDMRIDAHHFSQTVLARLAAPSTPEAVIEKAIEKAETGDKVTVADVKDWKAELEAERLRTQEFRQESNERRKKIRELEAQLELSERAPIEPEIRVVEKAPDDYEAAKRQASDLAAQTATLQQRLEAMEKQQGKIVSDGIKRGLQERQAELDKLEADKAMIEDIVARKKAYLDSLSSDVKRIETHREVINGARLELINLAAFLNDMEPMNDPDTINRWLALADMHQDAINAIHQVFGNQRHKIEKVACFNR